MTPVKKPTTPLVYPLVDGYVQHWLTLGPLDQPVAETPRASASVEPDFADAVELARVQMGEQALLWEMTHCAADHWLAWHTMLPTPTHRQAWGFVYLHSAQAQAVKLRVTATCAARVWVNGASMLHEGDFEQRKVVTSVVTADLRAGANPLLLRLETVDVGATDMMAALRVEPIDMNASPLMLHLPSVTSAPRRRQRMEASYARTRLNRAVYGRRDSVQLLAPTGIDPVPVQLRLQKPSGAIYAETMDKLAGGKTIESVRGSQLPDGALDAVVMAPFQEFYNDGLRARHTHPILVANQPFHPQLDAQAEADSRDARLIEALRAQIQQGEGVYSELAKMAFGLWEQVAPASIEAAVARVIDGAADALPDLLGLVTLRARMPAYQGFPPALLPPVDRGLHHFAAQADDNWRAWEMADEAVQLALLAARYLLGTIYPSGPKTPTADALVAWLSARGREGFAAWHSDHELLVMALAPLLSIAPDEAVRESAASLMDAFALAWALHSFGGTFGASRARALPHALRSGRFAPEAALMRLLWGVGGYQTGTEAAVALALTGNSYVLPDVIRAIALAQLDAAWVRERHGDAHVASFKTPDYLLASVQGYCAGDAPGREQVWQASLGSEALIFSNHPLSYRDAPGARPGWWVGNGSRPRVAQYHDALLARYALPAEAWLPFTHAYFPTYAFDEYALVEGWAFARVGEGYVALWSNPPFVLAEEGPDAGRELRAVGHDAVWLCQMGRRATDGDFAAFQRKVLAAVPQVQPDAVTWTTVRGDTLVMGRTGPLLVNGQAVALDDFPRHSSPFGHAEFPADQLDIVYGVDGLRLRF